MLSRTANLTSSTTFTSHYVICKLDLQWIFVIHVLLTLHGYGAAVFRSANSAMRGGSFLLVSIFL
jgi:hypothetical protein